MDFSVPSQDRQLVPDCRDFTLEHDCDVFDSVALPEALVDFPSPLLVALYAFL